MSHYIYKVTGKKAVDKFGRKCNILEYAYKPYTMSGYYDADLSKANTEEHRRSGCYNAERYVRTGKGYTGRVAMEAGGTSIEWSKGTIADCDFDHQVTLMMERARREGARNLSIAIGKIFSH